jgi:hypothetical protein
MPKDTAIRVRRYRKNTLTINQVPWTHYVQPQLSGRTKCLRMPDVGLLTATKPVPQSTDVIIRYSVEVGGLEVYNESYNVDTLAKELEKDRAKVLKLWERRLLCAVEARDRPGFSSALTRCVADGNACDYGTQNCTAIDELGAPA